MSDIDKIGALVRQRTLSLKQGKSPLISRAISDIRQLETDPEVIRLIDIISTSTDWNDRIYAWENIRAMGPATRGWTRALEHLIHSGDGWSAIFAAESLAAYRCLENQAVPVLLSTLESALDLETNDWAKMACGAIGNYKTLSLKMIRSCVPVLTRALESGHPDVRAYAARTLGNWGQMSSPALAILSIRAAEQPPPGAALYLEVLKGIDPSIRNPIDGLRTALCHTDPSIRANSVNTVSAAKKLAAGLLPELTALSGDPHEEVRRAVALCLGELQPAGADAISRLARLTRDTDPSVMLAAAYSLIKSGVDIHEHLELISRHLESENSGLRFFSSWALGNLKGICRKKQISDLKRALRRETNPKVRETIRLSIDRLKPKRSGIFSRIKFDGFVKSRN